MENTREIVLEILIQIEKEQIFGSALLRQVLDKYDYLEERDKGFIKRLSEGCMERQITLDYVIDNYSKTPVRKMKPFIRCLMRMSAYQILYMEQIPDSAACNEAVKIATRHKFAQLKGFVNGVLRTISREKDSILWPNEEKQPVQALSVQTSMPVFILDMWIQDYGFQKAKEIAINLCKERPITVRVDCSLTETEVKDLEEAWEKQGLSFTRDSECLEGYHFDKIPGGVQKLYGFAQGKVTVQDISSMGVARAAGLQGGETILDVCASPGGKSMHAACILKKHNKGGKVLARDISDYKCSRMEDNISRCHLEELIQVECKDATIFDEEMVGKADVLLLDVPCSGLGILAKKKDIKYHVTKEGLESLSALQEKIVETTIPYVKEGGKIVYSTCTIRRRENEEMAEWIANRFSLKCEGTNQIFPDGREKDGFFIAVFRK